MPSLSYQKTRAEWFAHRIERVRAPRRLWAALPAALMVAACSSTPKVVHVEPVSETRTTLSPLASTANNMVRLDAQLRSGCSTVSNIDRPGNDLAVDVPQTWTAHTCHGDLVYNVAAKSSASGPVVEVTPAGGAVDKPANPHFTPAMPGDPEDGPATGDRKALQNDAAPDADPAKTPAQ